VPQRKTRERAARVGVGDVVEFEIPEAYVTDAAAEAIGTLTAAQESAMLGRR